MPQQVQLSNNQFIIAFLKRLAGSIYSNNQFIVILSGTLHMVRLLNIIRFRPKTLMETTVCDARLFGLNIGRKGVSSLLTFSLIRRRSLKTIRFQKVPLLKLFSKVVLVWTKGCYEYRCFQTELRVADNSKKLIHFIH